MFFLLLFFCGICFAQNTVSGTTQGGMPLPEVMCILEKTVSSDVSGNYLIKSCHQEMLKYLFALVFNLLIQ
jgi:hypothetical protein